METVAQNGLMAARKPQISFQVTEGVKKIYEMASVAGGLNVTRMCAAGFLYLLEVPSIRAAAMRRLVEIEELSQKMTRGEMLKYVLDFVAVSEFRPEPDEETDRLAAEIDAEERRTQQKKQKSRQGT